MKSAILSFISMFFLPIIVLRGISAPVEETPKDDVLITEGEVTVTSLEELKRYTDAELFPQRMYEFYYDLISDDGEHEEFHTLKIPEFEITFEPSTSWAIKSNFKFTVTESDLDTLPVGKYEKEVALDHYTQSAVFPNDDRQWADSFSRDGSLVYKIFGYLTYGFYWDTYDYGENPDWLWFTNAVSFCHDDYYPGKTIPYEDFCKIAEEEFGFTDFELIRENCYMDEIYPSWDGTHIKFDYLETIEDDDSQTVVIQLYADPACLLKSHKVGYKFSKDGVKWLGCEVLEKSEYEPYLRNSLKEH